MTVLNRHSVKEDPATSTDWTTIGARILEAATMASAIHLQEKADTAGERPCAPHRVTLPLAGWDREELNGNG